MDARKKVFRSRISVLLIISILAIFIPVSLPAFKNRELTGILILGVTFLFIIFVLTGLRYIVTHDRLLIKLWFIKLGGIKIRDIDSVRRSYNILSSPAASFKRMGIYLIGHPEFPDALISPAREKDFLASLKAINPRIVIGVSEKKCGWRFWDWDI